MPVSQPRVDGVLGEVKLLWGASAIAFLLALGSLLFSFFEGMDLFNSFYWTVTVLTTVGFGDIVPRTFMGKLLYMGLVVSGIALYGYVASSLVSSLSEARLKKILAAYFPGAGGGGRLSGHVVMLGWNRFAESAYRELEVNGQTPLAVVEGEELAKSLSRRGIRVLEGGVEDESTLKEAGVERCRAVLVLGEDVEKNLVSILRVRKLAGSILIIVLSGRKEFADVYREAGATAIVDAYDVTGRIVAGRVFEPLASEVLADMAEAERDLDLVQTECGVDLTLGELEAKGFTSKIILVERDGRRFYTPGSSFQLRRGDLVVMVGLRSHLPNDFKLISGSD